MDDVIGEQQKIREVNNCNIQNVFYSMNNCRFVIPFKKKIRAHAIVVRYQRKAKKYYYYYEAVF